MGLSLVYLKGSDEGHLGVADALMDFDSPNRSVNHAPTVPDRLNSMLHRMLATNELGGH